MTWRGRRRRAAPARPPPLYPAWDLQGPPAGLSVAPAAPNALVYPPGPMCCTQAGASAPFTRSACPRRRAPAARASAWPPRRRAGAPACAAATARPSADKWTPEGALAVCTRQPKATAAAAATRPRSDASFVPSVCFLSRPPALSRSPGPHLCRPPCKLGLDAAPHSHAGDTAPARFLLDPLTCRHSSPPRLRLAPPRVGRAQRLYITGAEPGSCRVRR